jgi:hypothetical protein
MLFQIYNFLLFNPYLISLRLWASIHAPIANICDIRPHEDVKLSYIYSFIYSGVCTTVAPYSLYLFATKYQTVYLFINTPNPIGLIYYYFTLGFLTSDLLVGYQKYRRVLNKNIITSYIHHIAYILFFIYGNVNNKLNLYLLGLPFEIPIFVRSIEMINPELRQLYDTSKVFVILYFIFRILYNILLIVLAYQNKLPEYSIFLTLTLIMHSKWLINYVNKYIYN